MATPPRTPENKNKIVPSTPILTPRPAPQRPSRPSNRYALPLTPESPIIRSPNQQVASTPPPNHTIRETESQRKKRKNPPLASPTKTPPPLKKHPPKSPPPPPSKPMSFAKKLSNAR